MNLHTTKTVFPGGWRYLQHDADGKLMKAFRSMSPYSEFIEQIRVFRVGNRLPRATSLGVDEDVQAYLCEQVGGDPRYCINPGSKKNSWTRTLQHPVRAAKHAVAAVKTLAGGIGVLGDWLGAGLKPVPVAEAQDRADVCTGRLSGKKCDHNRADADFADFTQPIADAIHQQLEKKTQLKLSVEGEAALQTCDICLCALKLKVWTPMPTILNRTPQPLANRFKIEAPEHCWMRTSIP